MAKYESLGYCPNNEFINSSIRGLEEHSSAKSVRETLGSIQAYMVYEEHSFNPKGCYITEVMLTTEALGLQVATTLKCYIPKCVYPEGDTIVWIKDCIHPGMVTGTIFEDEKFLVGLSNVGDVTHIQIYKK